LGRAYASLRRELRGLMRQAVPEYGTALDTAADPISKRNALRLGVRALSARVTRDELAEEVAGMSAAELQYVGQGIRSQLDDAMANVKRAMSDPNMDAREAVQGIRMLTTRASRDKVATVLGEQRADTLFDAVEQSIGAFELRAGVARNSATFARTNLDEAIRKQTDEGIFNALRSGQPLQAGQRVMQALGGRTASEKERIADETYSALAEALTGPRGPNALAQLQIMQRLQAMQGPTVQNARRLTELAELLARRNVGVTGPAVQGLRRE